MAKLTIGRMAKLYGLHRSTLHEAVAKGRVTAGLDGKGQKIIDLSEMIRVYGEPSQSTLHFPTPPHDSPPTLPNDALHLLLEELQLLRAEVQELRKSMLRLEHKPDLKSKPPLKPKAAPAEAPLNAASPPPATTWASLFNALDD